MISVSIFPYCLREIQTLALTLSLIIMCQLYCYKVDNGTTIQGPQCIFIKKALDRSIQDVQKSCLQSYEGYVGRPCFGRGVGLKCSKLGPNGQSSP